MSTPRTVLQLYERFVERILMLIGVVLLLALILWVRQTPESLLQAESFAEAIAKIIFLSFPSLAVWLALFRTRESLRWAGLLVALTLSATWWYAATNQSSTASLGPGVTGWIGLPLMLWLVKLVAAVISRHRKS